MLKMVFYATVDNDLNLHFLNLPKVKQHILKFRGKTVEITIDERKKRRSNQSNAYYWGVVIKMIADTCGYRTSEEYAGIHSELKQKFLPKAGRLQIAKSTSSLSTVEFSEYIEKVRQWAAEELGVYIPDPSEVENA